MKQRHMHRRKRTGQRGLPLWGILCIVFGAALLISLIIGLILNATLDEETYYRLTSKPRTKQENTILFVPEVSDVTAYPYAFGGDLSEVSGRSSVSLALNSSGGAYFYRSDVLNYFGKGKDGGELLSVAIGALADSRISACGVFYPQSQLEQDVALRYAKEAEEAAVVREFFYLGGSDLLLCGLDLSSDAALSCLKAIKLAVEQKPVGAAIPYGVLLREDAGKLLERVLSVCDFVALDLHELESEKPLDELLAATKYSYTQYHMRLLLSQKQSKWIEQLYDFDIRNYEILK